MGSRCLIFLFANTLNSLSHNQPLTTYTHNNTISHKMSLLHQELTARNYRILLASGSPRRRELLAGAGLTFTVASIGDVEEVYPPQMDVHTVASFLSRLKADAYLATHSLEPLDILITADTTVICDNRLLGKPSCEVEARDMLATLSGRAHQVVTGVTVYVHGQCHTFDCTTTVTFDTLSLEQIEYYIANYSPYDKAGSYGIQEWIGYVGITHIDGSFYNVMGLPVQLLCRHLHSLCLP